MRPRPGRWRRRHALIAFYPGRRGHCPPGVPATVRSASPAAVFTAEESFAAGDRVVVRWRYDRNGGHVRGVDLFTVRDGLVAAKLACVKG